MMMNLSFNFRLIFILFLCMIFHAGCINWKARFIEQKHELEECQKAKETVKMESEPVIITEYVPGKKDTIYIDPDYMDKDFILPANKNAESDEYVFSKIVFEKQFQFCLTNDSIDIYITNHNELIGNQLIQEIILDSIKLNRKVKIISKNIPVKIDKTNTWRSIAIGGITGILIIIAGFFILNRWRTKK